MIAVGPTQDTHVLTEHSSVLLPIDDHRNSIRLRVDPKGRFRAVLHPGQPLALYVTAKLAVPTRGPRTIKGSVNQRFFLRRLPKLIGRMALPYKGAPK